MKNVCSGGTAGRSEAACKAPHRKFPGVREPYDDLMYPALSSVIRKIGARAAERGRRADRYDVFLPRVFRRSTVLRKVQE